MAINQWYKFSAIFSLFVQLILLPNNIEGIKWDVGHILHIPNVVDAIVSGNSWTENHECLIELNAIRNGIESNDEWVTKCK